MYKQATELMLNFKDRILIKGEEDTGKSTLLTEIRISDSDSRYYNFKTLRAYPNRVLFQTMTPQAKCSIAS